jgi:uncharacterized membrane protein YfcA
MVVSALAVYCFASVVANVGNGICGFGSGIMMVLGWQVANLLQLHGTVPFEHTQVLLVAMALPTSIFLTCRSWQSSAIDVRVCLFFGACNLCSYVAGLMFLLHVLLHSPALLKHILGVFFLAFAALRIASDCKLLPGSRSTETRPRGEHSPMLMAGWAMTGIISGGVSGIFGVGGPPIMVWMTVARMDKGSMRGTNQAGQVALQLLRVVSLLSTGVLRPMDDGVPLQLVSIVTAGVVGAVIGDQLHGSVSDAVVVRIILVLLLMGSVSMVVDLKGGSLAANVLVGCMACITIGLVLLMGRHVWLRCCGGADAAVGEYGTRLLAQCRSNVPAGARLCDTLLFGADPHRSSVGGRQQADEQL